MTKNGKFTRCCQALMGFLNRGAWGIILISLVLAGLSVYYAFNHLAFRTSRSDLIASDQRLLQLGEKLTKDFGSRDDLVVVVQNGHPSRSKAFADALAAELKKHPDDFPEIFYRLNPEAFKKWALLYLEPQQIQELKDKLQDHRGMLAALAANPSLTQFYRGVNRELTGSLVEELFVGFLDEGPQEEKLPDLSLLNASLRALDRGLEGKPYSSPLNSFFLGGLGDLDQEGYFFTENQTYLLFLVTPRKDDFTHAAHSVKLLRDIVDRVKSDFPGLEAGVTGPLALEADEMGSAMEDIALATWLSLASQMLLLILFFRSLKRSLIEALVLVVGLCWTFAVATLVVGHLNLLSIVFAPLMLGITIDYGIHWFCRLEEEQSVQGKGNGNTLACTMRRAAPAIIYAALAAAASFTPLTVTDFKGLAELGLILTLGVLIMLVATLTLLPSLVLVTERFTSVEDATLPDCQSGSPRPFLKLGWKHPRLIVAVGLFFTALGGVSLLFVNFDLNPLHLQNQKTESVVWEMKLLKDSRYSTAFGALTADNLEELKAKKAALKQLPTVSHVESILSFLPQGPEAKKEQLAGLAPLFRKISFPANPVYSDPRALAEVLGRIHFKLARAAEIDANLAQVKEANKLLISSITALRKAGPQTRANLKAFEKKFFQDLEDKWNFLQDSISPPLPRLADLPPEVRKRFVSPQGTFLIRAFSSEDIWDPAPLGRFVKDLRRVDPDAVGDPVLLYVFTRAFRNACLWAAGVGLVIITLMLWGVFRSFKVTLLALLPLFVGTGWTLNLMWLLGIPFNQANVLFLPLILGEGIEFGIIILVRWQMEESARVITLPASTAKGVLLAALTTTVGFGSLMVSGHQGTFSLGLLATVGSLSVLLASLSVLPAFLRLVEKQPALARPRLKPALTFKRWLLLLVGKELP